MIEKMIGPYEVVTQIGTGGMATVYKAYQSKLDRYVAIKVMHDSFMADSQFLARFEREARIVARLDHANIVPVYDYDEYEGKPYLVMKFIEGVTLKDILQKNTLSSSETLAILEPIADALHYAHLQGVLHRDVKPSNIILDPRSTPYLTDFGLARILQSGESTMSIDLMLGTPHYISPEQAQAKATLAAQTDVYALGIILYQLVTGQVPFAAESSYAIIHSHIYNPPPPPRQINPDVPSEVERVVFKALEKDPAHRYATPIELIEAYQDALGGQRVPAPSKAELPLPHEQEPIRSSQDTGRPSSRRKRVQVPTPHPPSRPLDSDDIVSQIGEELRETGQEIRKELGEAWREIWNAWHTSAKGNRHMRRPGSRQGFYMGSESHEDERLRRWVKKRLEERRRFKARLSFYLLVNLLVIFIWATTGAGYFWPIWVMGPWGLGMAFYALNYWNEHGGGRVRAERALVREIAVERQREATLRGEYHDYEGGDTKPKREDLDEVPPRVRLNDDGEFTESFVDQLDDSEHRKL